MAFLLRLAFPFKLMFPLMAFPLRLAFPLKPAFPLLAFPLKLFNLLFLNVNCYQFMKKVVGFYPT